MEEDKVRIIKSIPFVEEDRINYFSKLPKDIIIYIALLLDKSDILSYCKTSKKFEYLSLSWNQIKEIPKELGQLTNIKTLYLTDNQIKEIPSELGKLTNLQELSLNKNQIKEIPKELRQLTNLEWLYLTDNKIKEIPI